MLAEEKRYALDSSSLQFSSWSQKDGFSMAFAIEAKIVHVVALWIVI